MFDFSKFTQPDLEPVVKRRRTDAHPQPVIVSAVRTAIGRFLGTIGEMHPADLAASCIGAAIKRAGLKPEQVDEVILGNVVSAGLGQNPARQAAVKAGLPPHVGALLINKVCASSLKAVILAAQAIKTADAEIVIAGGMESMSRAPYLLDKARTGYRMGSERLIDAVITDGLWCSFHDFHMGMTAELVAEAFGITRKMQDEYAIESHRKAVAAIKAGKFKSEIVPIQIQKKKETITFEVDESPREDTSLEALAKLKPVFKPDGTVTAGNAPGLSDGAAAVVVTSEKKAEELGLQPMARILDYFTSGLSAEWVMLTPIPAVKGLLARNERWKLSDFDLFEFNEAFSAQALACVSRLGVQPERVNVHGGAVALGHPIGASGARILVTLLNALRDRGGKKGIAALCLGGGNGVAMAVELM